MWVGDRKEGHPKIRCSLGHPVGCRPESSCTLPTVFRKSLLSGLGIYGGMSTAGPQGLG